MKNLLKTSAKIFLLFFLTVCSEGNSFAQDSIVEAQVIDSKDTQIDKLYNDAVAKMENKKFKDAVNLFTEAITQRSSFQKAFYNRGVAYYKLEAYEHAMIDFDSSNRILPTFDAYYFAGLSAVEQKDTDAAISFLTKACETDNSRHEAFYSRGGVYFGSGEYEKAKQDFSEVLKRNKSNAFAYNDRGSAKRKLDDYSGAIADYKKAVLIDKDFALAYNNMGSALRKNGDAKAAIRAYDKCIAKDRDNYITYNNRGSAKYELGDFEGAEEDFSNAIELNPQYAFAFNNRGSARFKQDKLKGAEEDFNQAIRLDEKYAYAYKNRGNVRELLRDEKGACADWKKAKELGAEGVTAVGGCN